jgi:hypothetical protein
LFKDREERYMLIVVITRINKETLIRRYHLQNVIKEESIGMARKSSRIDREKKTVEAMIRIYCSRHHETKDVPCSECQELLEYARARLDGCPFGDDKSTCVKCTVHCYKPEMRERVRTVMRFPGPRIIYHHPVLAVLHIRDGKRKSKKASNEND